MPSTPPRLRLAMLGLKPDTRRLLVAFFRHGAGAAVAEPSPAEEADLGLIDLDEPGARARWEDCRRRHGFPLIALTLHPRELPDTLCVAKPVQAAELLAALERARPLVARHRRARIRQRLLQGHPAVQRELQAQLAEPPARATATAAARAGEDEDTLALCGDQPAEHYEQTAPPESLYYRPAEHLQDLLARAIDLARRSGEPVYLRGLGKPVVVFDGGQRVWCGLPGRQLRALCRLRFPAGSAARLIAPAPSLKVARLRRSSQRADALLWLVVLWCARGRIPAGTRLDRPFALSAWPNLTRLVRPPHALRLAALWHRQAISLRATQLLLPVPPRCIFTFYSACHAWGLVVPQSRPGRLDGRPAPPAGESGLLRRLLRYLSGGGRRRG